MRAPGLRLLSALVLSLASLSAAAGWDDQILDLTTVKSPSDAYNDVKPKSLNKESSVFVRLTDLKFVTQCVYTAGDRYVGVWGQADLVGIDDATFQSIADEYQAYLEQKLAGIFTVNPFAQVEATKGYAKTKFKNPPEPLGVEKETGLKVMAIKLKQFTGGNRAIVDGWDAGTWMAAMEVKAGSTSWMNQVEFAFLAENSGISMGASKKTATLNIDPFLWMSNAGNNFMSQKMAIGGYAGKKALGLPAEKAWVKNVSKTDENHWRIEADPALYKEAVLKMLKLNADLIIVQMKTVKED